MVFVALVQREIISAVNLELAVIAATEEVIPVHGEGERGNSFLGDLDSLDIVEGLAVNQEDAAVAGP